uniref:DUF4939 domain-containing protein n=1 Tax=Pseudonaja textilis TaxID=8673 RepID=A0A670YG10_PSETE
ICSCLFLWDIWTLTSVPDKFSGQPEMFPAFMGQCQLFMSLRPEDFPDDQAQVGFVISLLSGSAARWATPLLLQNSPCPPTHGRNLPYNQRPWYPIML